MTKLWQYACTVRILVKMCYICTYDYILYYDLLLELKVPGKFPISIACDDDIYHFFNLPHVLNVTLFGCDIIVIYAQLATNTRANI